MIDNMQNRLGRTIVKINVLLLCLFMSFAIGAEENCLKLSQILNLFKENVDQVKIIELVKTSGVNFKLDLAATRELARVDANDDLFAAIEQHICEAPLVITFPSPGDKVGRSVRIEGKSKNYPGRALWIFAHLEGLEVWWPQRGVVKLKPDGSWRQGAFLGSYDDIGFDFEITAIWVDEKVSQALVQYLATGEATGSYPGMRLPDGEPTAMVVVHKVSH